MSDDDLAASAGTIATLQGLGAGALLNCVGNSVGEQRSPLVTVSGEPGAATRCEWSAGEVGEGTLTGEAGA